MSVIPYSKGHQWQPITEGMFYACCLCEQNHPMEHIGTGKKKIHFVTCVMRNGFRRRQMLGYAGKFLTPLYEKLRYNDEWVGIPPIILPETGRDQTRHARKQITGKMYL